MQTTHTETTRHTLQLFWQSVEDEMKFHALTRSVLTPLTATQKPVSHEHRIRDGYTQWHSPTRTDTARKSQGIRGAQSSRSPQLRFDSRGEIGELGKFKINGKESRLAAFVHISCWKQTGPNCALEVRSCKLCGHRETGRKAAADANAWRTCRRPCKSSEKRKEAS